MNLKNVPGQIETYGFNCHWVAPFLAVVDNCSMAHCDAGGAGATRSIRKGLKPPGCTPAAEGRSRAQSFPLVIGTEGVNFLAPNHILT